MFPSSTKFKRNETNEPSSKLSKIQKEIQKDIQKKLFECAKCAKVYKSCRQTLQCLFDHGFYMCKICFDIIPFEQKKTHIEKSHVKNNMWNCALCKKKFNTELNLKSHVGEIHLRNKGLKYLPTLKKASKEPKEELLSSEFTGWCKENAIQRQNVKTTKKVDADEENLNVTEDLENIITEYQASHKSKIQFQSKSQSNYTSANPKNKYAQKASQSRNSDEIFKIPKIADRKIKSRPNTKFLEQDNTAQVKSDSIGIPHTSENHDAFSIVSNTLVGEIPPMASSSKKTSMQTHKLTENKVKSRMEFNRKVSTTDPSNSFVPNVSEDEDDDVVFLANIKHGETIESEPVAEVKPSNLINHVKVEEELERPIIVPPADVKMHKNDSTSKHPNERLSKIEMQKKVANELRLQLKSHFMEKKINSEQYKTILRNLVPKITKEAETKPQKIRKLVQTHLAEKPYFIKPASSKDHLKEQSEHKQSPTNNPRVNDMRTESNGNHNNGDQYYSPEVPSNNNNPGLWIYVPIPSFSNHSYFHNQNYGQTQTTNPSSSNFPRDDHSNSSFLDNKNMKSSNENICKGFYVEMDSVSGSSFQK